MVRRKNLDPSGPKLQADRAKALALLPVSRETLERLDRYAALLLQWQPTINLVASSTLAHLWTRHIADSLQLLTHAPEARVWADLGSGAGFPGLAIACALPAGGRVHLVESDTRKAAFLREAIRVTGAPAQVHAVRIETFAAAAGPIDVVTARGLASMPALLGLLAPFLQKGAQALLLKGQDVEAELTEAAKSWSMDYELLPSVTDPAARIVRVTRAAPRRA